MSEVPLYRRIGRPSRCEEKSMHATRGSSEAVPRVVPICEGLLTGFLPEDKGPYALTPNKVELIPTLGALSPPRRARPGPGPHICPQKDRSWLILSGSTLEASSP